MTERYYEALRAARAERGVQLKDVARDTRISQRVLEALESGNTQILPQAYVRAFIRDYATYLGLDAAAILADFESQSPSTDSTPAYTPPPAARYYADPAPAPTTTEGPVAEPPRRIQPMKPPRVKRVDTNLTAVIAIGIVILTGFVLVYFFLSGDANDKKMHTVTSPAPPPPIVPQYTPAVPQEKPVQDTAKPTTAAPYASDSLTLEATTVDSVWMSVVADTAHVQRGVMAKGTHQVWKAKSKFLLTLGNSRMAKLTLNGRVLRANDSAKSRVLRNVVIVASTTDLVPYGPEPAAPPAAKPAAPPQKTTTPAKPAPIATPYKSVGKPQVKPPAPPVKASKKRSS